MYTSYMKTGNNKITHLMNIVKLEKLNLCKKKHVTNFCSHQIIVTIKEVIR